MAMTPSLTRVTLQSVRGRAHAYLRFGRPVQQVALDAQHTIGCFAAGALFCRVRWERITASATSWQASVLCAETDANHPCLIEGVYPGGIVLLHVEGESVHALLRMIDAMEAQGIDPCAVHADIWRDVGSRAAMGFRSMQGSGR
jgi:uncharacterized protein DUF2840